MTIGQPFNPFGLFTGIFIPESLVRSPLLSPGAKLCYGRLCRYAGQDGECFPRQDTLADELAVSSRTVRTYLTELISAGFIAIHQRGLNRTNTYVFLWHSVLDSTPRKTPPPQTVVSTGPEENFHSGVEENCQSRVEENFRSYKGRREVFKRRELPPQIAALPLPALPSLPFEKTNQDNPVEPPFVIDSCWSCHGVGYRGRGPERSKCGVCRGSGQKTKTA